MLATCATMAGLALVLSCSRLPQTLLAVLFLTCTSAPVSVIACSTALVLLMPPANSAALTAPCVALLWTRGKHAIKCKCQGLVDARHNDLRDWSADSWKDCTGLRTTKEQHVPRWDTVNRRTGQTIEARLDVATSDPSTGESLYFDVCVWTASCNDPNTLHTRATHDGRTAADAAADKRRRYDRAGPSLIPLALEPEGRPGEDLISFVRRCGAAWAATHDDDLSAYSRLWYECSTTLQRGNAELILAAIGV